VERLIREPYKWGRLALASAVGIGLGALMWRIYASDEYGGLGPVYGVTFAVSGVALGAAWGTRGRTQWRPVLTPP
jgi:hypothetical protein